MTTVNNVGEAHACLIQRLELHGFKAFERFTLRLNGDAYVAGPNNAGKSTIIAALRACAYMLRIARRRRPLDTPLDRGNEVLGYHFDSSQVALIDENLRHEFRDLEARLVLHLSAKRRLTAVWPSESARVEPFFYLQSEGHSVHSAREASDAFPWMGVVPLLSPVEQQEPLLTSKYVRENLDGPLASRHFRNQLWLLREEPSEGEDYEAFLDFIEPWVSELAIRELATRRGESSLDLDLYYREPGRRSDKEICWVGDGIQIWLQILLHIFRLQDYDVIVLDEPDVFLHPDLQRRLVRLLETLEGQIIMATHSPEVLAEAPPEAVVWVDRTRRQSVTAPESAALFELTSRLGTQFNIRLARAMRSRVVLFVEGQDMKLVREVAATLGATRTSNELELTVIPLHGFDNWDRVEPFKWLVDELLDGAIEVFVVLDRDYKRETSVRAVTSQLSAIGVHCTVWKRKELESYLLVTPALARVSGAKEDWLEAQLAEIATDLESEVFAQFAMERQRGVPRDHFKQVMKDAKSDFDALWLDTAERINICPAKEVLSRLNERLQRAGHSTFSFVKLARSILAEEVPGELVRLVDRVEEALD